MLTIAELDEIRRQVRQRRHLSWATLDKLIAAATQAATPKPEPKREHKLVAGLHGRHCVECLHTEAEIEQHRLECQSVGDQVARYLKGR